MLRSPCMFTISITVVVSSLKTVSSLCLGSDTLYQVPLALGNALLTVFMLWHLVLDHLSPCLLTFLVSTTLLACPYLYLVRHPTLGYCGPSISSAYGHLPNSFRTELFKNNHIIKGKERQGIVPGYRSLKRGYQVQCVILDRLPGSEENCFKKTLLGQLTKLKHESQVKYYCLVRCVCVSHSVVSSSLWPRGL